jgi:hypothetical protein
MKRIDAKRAAEITGDHVRTVQAHAALGAIPGARKNLAGRWTFDEAMLRAHMERLEAERCQSVERQRVATGVVKRSGAARRSPGWSGEQAYEQAMQKLLKGGAKHGATAS